MDKIQLVDLKNQYLKIKEEVDQAVLGVIDSCQFINGPEVKEFQKDLENYLSVKHVIPCANGTDALQIALMALGVKPGDEVITPSFTYVATCEVVALLGATPVFCEVYSDTFNIDTADLESKITSKTKAIIPVHLYGQCANMEEVMRIANAHQIPVIEDTAQAIGADFTYSDGAKKKAGTIGSIGTTSFFPSKNLGAYGDGGAIFTNDDDLADHLRKIANHGQTKRYFHDMIGVNSRLDSIQAAILRIKLKHLDAYSSARREAAEYYNSKFEEIEEITTPFVANYSNHVYHQYTIKLHGVNREGLQEHLNDKGIPNNIYYPKQNHHQAAFTAMIGDVSMPNTEEIGREVLSLPMHTELSIEQLEFISSSIIEYINSNKS